MKSGDERHLTPQECGLKREQDHCRARIGAIQKLMTQTCEVMGHIMVDDGHDSHYNWERCVRCDHKERS
jgi:hypothetical protein